MLNADLDSEFKSLLSMPADPSAQAGASRRTVIKTALGVGYAASVLPIMAQTVITTTADGLTAGEVTIPAQGGFKLPAYRAQPAGKTGLPVVLVLSEIFGVHEHIADVARRFAHAGYLAVAPELFVRQGDAKSYTEIGKLMSEVISKVPDAQVQSDLDATLAWAGAHGGDLRRVGVTGFCWGGRQVWLYTAHNPAIKAGVAWYGRLVGASSDLTPKQPVDVAGQLKGPVLGLYGEADTGIPQDSIAQMKQVLAAGNTNAKASQFVVYKDAPHAFHADYRPSYRKEAAEDGWKRALAWFKLNGVV
ncbi:carboxymethylenebutenolidase [Hylemonella gracilis str. Niagara R]|uniref:Carboxymethylenebutenolidase n=1 Tax=Hylemonella gracilis str. Niagara R TaxID=1458275 RepID=A0A016XFM3_9BURK|nr:dienelactone hydrolase family protein [Hylemonella gracilis]EYC50611.1 carboxymethylenebutenolidase [Hylemonella gracilis str. Niagara R]